jgi:sulfur-oxidizing protein SoxB
MDLSRREFIQVLAAASAAGFSLTGCDKGEEPTAADAKGPSNPYELAPFGNVSFMHYTDCHAQLMPVYFREPSINLGIASMYGRPPHLVGQAFMEYYGMQPGTSDAHAFTYIDFADLARKYGKVGGFAHLATLVKNVRAQRPGALMLDGGDTWQGSATSLWTNAQDMVDAQKLLGVDIMTPHWEMTFGAERVQEIVQGDFAGQIDFVAQNIFDTTWGERVFQPYVLKEQNGVPIAVIGQAFPYTPIANPRHLIPEWSFGIRPDEMQDTVDAARADGAQVVVVVSHNGMDVDLKMASEVSGIDAILGGHTHDAVPRAMEMKNPGGTTLVMNSGSNGKFLSVLDLDVKDGKVTDYRYKLLPVFANLIEPDAAMAAHIEQVRAPYLDQLGEELAVTDETLYRRGNFNGTFDQVICDALMQVADAEIAFSPGFRWGVSVLPGDPITFEHVMTQTAITYPNVTRNEISGAMLKVILEDVADNIFNEDPYFQQGGDMVRVGGLSYAIDPTKTIGERITGMEINGQPIDADKNYVVAGWASVQETPAGDTGRPVWDMVAEYLRDVKTISSVNLNKPKISGVDGNPGMEL